MAIVRQRLLALLSEFRNCHLAHLYLAYVADSAGELDQCIDHCEQALALLADTRDAQSLRFELLLQLGDARARQGGLAFATTLYDAALTAASTSRESAMAIWHLAYFVALKSGDRRRARLLALAALARDKDCGAARRVFHLVSEWLLD